MSPQDGGWLALCALVRNDKIGLNQSTAIADAVANISANTTVNSNESCAASQDITFNRLNVVIGSINCGGPISLGNISVLQNAQCSNNQQISVLSKIVADQAAKTNSSTGLGFLDSAIAESSTFIDMQNNIAAFMNATCYNSQKITVGSQNYNIGSIVSKSSCSLFNSAFSQNSACVNDIIASFTNTNDLSQVASATAAAGLDLSSILAILVVILIILAIVFIAPGLFTASIGGKSLGKIFKVGGTDTGVPVNQLRARVKQLQRAVGALQAQGYNV